MLFKNCSYYLNLVFFFCVFYVLKKKKKLGAKRPCFPYYPFFLEPKAVIKNCKQIGSKFPFAYEKILRNKEK